MDKPFWKSRKWWMAIIGVVVPVANHIFNLGMNTEEITALVAPIVAYIIGQGYVDGKRVE